MIDSEILKLTCNLLQIACRRHRHVDLLLIEKAVAFANQAHQGQYRDSGEPFVTHPIIVATILAEQYFDIASVITALLHDTVEDTNVTCENIAAEFSPEIATLVDGITKLQKIDYQPAYVRQAENFRKFLLALSRDLRVLIVKLADRLHNMQTLSAIREQKKHSRIALETLAIYAPLAERVGMHQFKDELEDLAFAVVHPELRESIKNKLLSLTAKDELIIEITSNELRDLLNLHNINAKVFGRKKTPYSIWSKMERKGLSFEQLSDIIAFRIIVQSVTDCYQALGIIHTCYKTIPGGFKDYISIPKSNQYRSLHTLFFSNFNQRVEVQIRTEEMDEIAKLGLAAHWAYKHRLKPSDVEMIDSQCFTELIESLRQSNNPEEVLESAKLDLYNDQVFCFTTNGKLVSLPRGATPVDFAFALDPNIGLLCAEAEINGQPAKLNSRLENGDKVKIITKLGASPSPTWENFIVTHKAKSHVRKFFKTRQLSEMITLGRIFLIQGLRQNDLFYNEQHLLQLLKIFQKKNVEELLLSIGKGTLNKTIVIQALCTNGGISKRSKTFWPFFQNPFKPKSFSSKSDKAIKLNGTVSGMSTMFASCCSPIPGDKVVGIIIPTQGILVHVMRCHLLNTYIDEPEKWLSLSWGTQNHSLYVGKIMISLRDQPGALAQVAQGICAAHQNVLNIRVLRKKFDMAEILVEVEVSDLRQLNLLISNLKRLSLVYNAERFVNTV